MTTAVRSAALATLMLAVPCARALQLIEASDGVSIEAIASIKEPTRIRIEGAPITDVFGNIHFSHCGALGASPALPGTAGIPGISGGPGGLSPPPDAVNPSGEVVLQCDRDKGEIYIRPVGDAGKPINLFVSSASATYTLLLRRADTPADTIVIRDKTPRSFRAFAAQQPPAGPAPNHIRAMKALLLAMASDRAAPEIQVSELNRPVQLRTQSTMTLLRQYEGRGLLGEKYHLQNVGPDLMVLREQEFDRDSGQVIGVAIEYHKLRPQESTSVYVIRRESAP